ncbi:MAG: LytTR family transcriptional regulator DNA-binding domain-containing protein [Ruminococcus sp.]|nr:LytTR family transcriptional regulator DNA-binding domain-containing protein [Ruminococcus sp.]
MIAMLAYSQNKKELVLLKKLSNEVVCRISEEDWDFLSYENKELLMEFLETNPQVDISCVDVAADRGVETAEKLHSNNKNTYIILIVDSTISPMAYIRPSIMAASLLMRPIEPEMIKKVLADILLDFVRHYRLCSNNENFVIDNRDGRQFIPYDRIVFFESRNKKIYINTEHEEYSFYDTLENIEQNIGDGFVRCHRSFIVAKNRIKKILLSQNTVLLDNDYQVPLSRSYKSALKELR